MIYRELSLKKKLEDIDEKIRIIDWKIFKECLKPVLNGDDTNIKLLYDERFKLEQERRETAFKLETFVSFLSNER